MIECYVLQTWNHKWNELINKLPYELQDVYFIQEYLKLEELDGNGIAELFVCMDDEKNIAVYAYIKRKIEQWNGEGVYYDIQTPYGYGGPLSNSNEPFFLNEFEEKFLQYCMKSNIIAEFIRFHPLIKNQNIFHKNIEVVHNRYTVCIDLEKSEEELWNSQFTSTNRNRIRKGQKNHLEIEISYDYKEFISLYYETMNKVNANEFYYFNNNYFEELIKIPNTVVFYTKYNDEIVAAAILLRYGKYIHYHLGGSRREYLNQYAPNNFMFWEAIKYAKSIGCKKFHLGGGITDSREDKLFHFKSMFSKDVKDFYIGKRIHNKNVYEKLLREWEIEHNRKSEILLEYRTK